MSLADCLKDIQRLAHELIQKHAEHLNIRSLLPIKFTEGFKALQLFVKNQKVASIVIFHDKDKVRLMQFTLQWNVDTGFEIIAGNLWNKSRSLHEIANGLKDSLATTIDFINKKIDVDKKEIEACENFISILEEVQKQKNISEKD